MGAGVSLWKEGRSWCRRGRGSEKGGGGGAADSCGYQSGGRAGKRALDAAAHVRKHQTLDPLQAWPYRLSPHQGPGISHRGGRRQEVPGGNQGSDMSLQTWRLRWSPNLNKWALCHTAFSPRIPPAPPAPRWCLAHRARHTLRSLPSGPSSPEDGRASAWGAAAPTLGRGSGPAELGALTS